MTSKHTPGPWIAKGNDGRYNNSRNSWRVDDEESACSEAAPITIGGGTVIAFAVASDDSYFTDARVDANAHLIAAAPELLAELEMLSNIVEGCGLATMPEVECRIAFARAAIAKATGAD